MPLMQYRATLAWSEPPALAGGTCFDLARLICTEPPADAGGSDRISARSGRLPQHVIMIKINPSSTEWLTHAEQTDYRETPRYDATIDYCTRLADRHRRSSSSNHLVRADRAANLPLLIAAEAGTFTPEAAKAERKPVFLIQACIHSGEPDGKDAGLALLRDIAITKTRIGHTRERGAAVHSDLQHRWSRALKSLQSHQSKRSSGHGMAHDQPFTKTSIAIT